jgi:hypothetical protein
MIYSSPMDMTKRAVKQALGITQDTQLARFFGTTKQAVGRWDEDELLPDGRAWQARALRPDLFPVPADEQQDRAEPQDPAQSAHSEAA